jgi:hypothetical protein
MFMNNMASATGYKANEDRGNGIIHQSIQISKNGGQMTAYQPALLG